MAYIGKEPIVGNFQKCDAITTSSTATYNLTVSSVAVSPETPNNCIVSLNGVIQAPTSAYTISGSQIIFNSSLTSSDVIDFILILGNVLDIGTPSDGTVSTAKIADVNVTTGKIANDAITLAKMASGTDGNIISYDASGNPVAIATGSDGQVLTSTGAGSPPAFEAAAGGAWNFISSHTASSSANIAIESGITSTYDLYMFDIALSTSTGNCLLDLTFQVGGSYVTSDYRYVVKYEMSDGTDSLQRSTSTSSIRTNADGVSATEAQMTSMIMYLHKPADTTFYKSVQFHGQNFNHDSLFNSWRGSGELANAAAITGWKLTPRLGNFTSGTVRMYGCVKS